MISHKHKFIFIHVPKCGGMSIESALRSFECERVLRHGEKNSSTPHLMKHATALDFKNNIKNLNDYFKFTFVRNPWSWAVSNFLFNEGRHAPYLKNLEKSGYKIYKRHLNSHVEKNGVLWQRNIQNVFEFWLDWWIKACDPSQSMMFNDENGNSLVDFIGKLEDFQTDFDIVTSSIGIREIKLPHRNKSKKLQMQYKNYYNNNSKKMIEEQFKDDLNLFNYAFDE